MMLIASLIFIDIIAISFVQMHSCHDIFIYKGFRILTDLPILAV